MQSRDEVLNNLDRIAAFCDIGPLIGFRQAYSARLGLGSALMNCSQAILIDATLGSGGKHLCDKAKA